LHRSDLISNIQANDPNVIQRLAQYQAGTAQAGLNALSTTEASYRILDLVVIKQSYLQAYLDGFLLISAFFICAIPFMFLLRKKKLDAATVKKVQEESH